MTSIECELIREAKEIISDPKRHTKYEYARDAAGNSVDNFSTNAVAFCSIGVCRYVAMKRGMAPRRLLRALENHVPSGKIVAYNDSPFRKHADIVALFTAAEADLCVADAAASDEGKCGDVP